MTSRRHPDILQDFIIEIRKQVESDGVLLESVDILTRPQLPSHVRTRFIHSPLTAARPIPCRTLSRSDREAAAWRRRYPQGLATVWESATQD